MGGINDCWATVTHWGVIFATSSRKLTISAPTNEYTHVATGTQITVQIGTNATNQLQGNSRITNPSSAGVYTLTLYGSAGSSGDFLVSINAGQLVSAVIAENLAFTVSSVSATSIVFTQMNAELCAACSSRSVVFNANKLAGDLIVVAFNWDSGQIFPPSAIVRAMPSIKPF